MKTQRFLGWAVLTAAAILSSGNASAQPYYWDNDGATPGFGTAAGTWADSTTGNATQGWSTSTTGVVVPGDVTTLITDSLNFGLTATGLASGTITVSGMVNAGSLTFASGSGAITLSDGTINLGAASTITVSNTTNTISSVLSGAGTSLTKNGATTGTLVLSGANTYTGLTSVAAGFISINSIKNVGAGASALGAPTSVANGTLGLGFGTTATGLIYIGTGDTTDRVINVRGTSTAGRAILDMSGTGLLKFTSDFTASTTGSKVLTLQGSSSGEGEIAGAIVNNSAANTTSIVKTGTGTWTLSGANTYTGTTTVSGGTLNINNRSATASAMNNVTVSGGSTLNIGGGTLVINNTMFVGSTTSGTVNQSAGTLSFSISTTSTNALLLGNGANSNSTGTYNLSGGTINLNTTNQVRGIILGVNAGTSSNFIMTGGTIANNASSPGFLQVGRSLDFPAANTFNLFSQSAGSVTLTRFAIGGSAAGNTNSTLTLTGGTFTVNTTFSSLAAATNDVVAMNIGGTAQVTLPAFPLLRGVGSSATITFDSSDGGYLRPTASSATYIQAGTFNGANLTANGAKFDTNTFDITIAQAFQNAPSATGTLTKLGVGTLTLSGASTYTGVTTINAGTLRLGANSVLPSASPVTLSGGTLALAPGTINGNTTGGVLTLAAGTSTIDFGGAGITLLSFGDSVGATWTGTLAVTGYTGPGNSASGSGATQLFIGASNTLSVGQLAAITFTGFDMSGAATQLSTGEVVPLGVVPEPATILGLSATGLGLAGWFRRRRQAKASA